MGEKKTIGATLATFWARLGPGLLLAATAIGASHLVMAPQAGALFGVSLLWLVPLAHIIKYPAFEFGPRYAAARGESLLAAYRRAPEVTRRRIFLETMESIYPAMERKILLDNSLEGVLPLLQLGGTEVKP